MTDTSTPGGIARVLKKHGLQPKKKLGQNFLVDGNILDKIVSAANLSNMSLVLEIGPGLGSLTRRLAAQAGQVVALELDDRLLPVLQEIMQDCHNVTLLQGDALKIDLDNLMWEQARANNYKVVANLPYYITTPIIFKLLEDNAHVTELIVMVQQEVADRMTAVPGSKVYGVLSVAVAFYCRATVVTRVKRTVFYPRPDVDSAVVKLEVLPSPGINVEDKQLYFKVVKAAFGQRRKTLVNALNATLAIDKLTLENVIRELGFESRIRGENLSPAEFAKVTQALMELR